MPRTLCAAEREVHAHKDWLIHSKGKRGVFFIGLNEGNGGLQIDRTMCLVVPGSQNEREGGVEVLVCLAVNVTLVT